jgi:hypothetical protein
MRAPNHLQAVSFCLSLAPSHHFQQLTTEMEQKQTQRAQYLQPQLLALEVAEMTQKLR